MNVVCIIQARMGSTRFPGKVLAMLHGHPVIWHVYTRCQQAVPNTVVATTNLPGDDPLADYLRTIDAPVFRWDGPENDVLGRYAACLKIHQAEWVVRVTGDCPLVDPQEIALMVQQAQRQRAYYTYRDCPRGFNVEVYDVAKLLLQAQFDDDEYRREHLKPMPADEWPNLSIDTPEDLERVRALIADR
jgi:spore coat polysaccharide biosynthesis protein SpsF (cytidylyltransferase family)